MLLHTEYSLLSLLSNQENVVHHHGFFKVSLIFETFYFFRYADSCVKLSIKRVDTENRI